MFPTRFAWPAAGKLSAWPSAWFGGAGAFSAREPRATVAVMRQLLLLRHAKAAWDDPAMPDHGRPLNPRGRQAGQALQELMRHYDLRAELALVSSARRTLQTLQSLSPWIAPAAVEPLDQLYLASPADMLHILRQVTPSFESILLIGHNPGLHALALMLTDRPLAQSDAPGAGRLAEHYPTACLAQFSVACAWDMLDAGAARLVRFLSPTEGPR